ncbi:MULTISPECIES: hypothetical protein [Cryobacterium]|nr:MULTISPECIES: hypothetical protein [Cryobacterium]
MNTIVEGNNHTCGSGLSTPADVPYNLVAGTGIGPASALATALTRN